MAGVRSKPLSSGKYRGWFTDHTGKQRFFTGTRHKSQTRRMAQKVEDEHRQMRLGYRPMPSSTDNHASRSFDGITAEYLEWGEAQGGRGGRPWGATHLRNRRQHLAWWKASLKLTELGHLDGILPKVESALRDMRRERTGRTVAHYAETLHTFCRWCVERDYLEKDPLAKLKSFDTTPVTKRRALTAEEIIRLLHVAPAHRRLLLETAFLSGLRARELRELTVGHLDIERSGLTLDANFTKNRRSGFQPLPGDLVERLALWAQSGQAKRLYAIHHQRKDAKPNHPANPLLYVPTHTARALDKDLKKAGIEKETIEGKVDFHACRTAYITLILEGGASVKEAQELARHATPQLTMNVYGRARGHRLQEVVERVADLLETAADQALSMHMVPGEDADTQQPCGEDEMEAAGIEPGRTLPLSRQISSFSRQNPVIQRHQIAH